jgi:insertion element IS1 protein InsB
MWSFVGAKATERWLWPAIDHHTGRVLAYVRGTRKDVVFLKLKALLAPFGITRYYTDKAGVYQRHLPPAQHTASKLTMPKIERKHLTLRTRLKRLARKTLCFSRSRIMHAFLIGLYLEFYQSQAALGSCKSLVCLVSPFLPYFRGVTPESASAAKVLA